MTVSIHTHKDGSTIGAIDLDKVEAVTVRKGRFLTYCLHNKNIEVECKDALLAEKVIQAFIHRNDEQRQPCFTQLSHRGMKMRVPKPYAQWVANLKTDGERLAVVVQGLLDMLDEFDAGFSNPDEEFYAVLEARKALKKHEKLSSRKLTDMGKEIK